MKCKHRYKFINDGDYGSHYLCKKCGHREDNWRKVMYRDKDPLDKWLEDYRKKRK